ncbi:MAG: transposase [Lentimonas sp.]
MHQIQGFVYTKIKMIEGTKDPRIIAEVQPPRGSKPQCPGGEKRSATYDHMPTARLFEFIAIFNISVFLEYAMRRVDCPDCGVKVEQVPWA